MVFFKITIKLSINNNLKIFNEFKFSLEDKMLIASNELLVKKIVRKIRNNILRILLGFFSKEN